MDNPEINLTHELVGDLQALADEAGTLAQDVLTGKPTAEAVATLKAQFEVAQSHFSEICGEAKEKMIEVKDSATNSIRANPYRTVAIVAGGCFLAGLLAGRVFRK
ncbi:MAG TPA: hypothetical protein VIM69_03635 [Opitutaceae bacterium]